MAEAAPQAAVEGGVPKIAADEALFNFGGVKPQSTVEHVFTIKNVGTGDLHIEGVKKT